MTSMGLTHWNEIFCPSYQGMCGCGSTSNSRPLLAWRMSDLVDNVVTQYVLAATVFIFCTSEQGIRTVSDSNPFQISLWWWFGKRWRWLVGDVVLLVHLRRGSPRDKTGFAMSFSWEPLTSMVFADSIEVLRYGCDWNPLHRLDVLKVVEYSSNFTVFNLDTSIYFTLWL